MPLCIFQNINDSGTITEQSGLRANTRNWWKFNHPDNAAVHSFDIGAVSFTGAFSEVRNSTWLTQTCYLGGWVAPLRGHKDSNLNWAAVSLCSYLLQVWPFLWQNVIVNIHFHSGDVFLLTMWRSACQRCPAVTVCHSGRVKWPTADWFLGNAGHLLTRVD